LRKYFLPIFFIFTLNLISAQNLTKTLQAYKTHSAIEINGIQDEKDWEKAAIATEFIQSEPVPGNASFFKTEALFLYDNNAIYIGARMYDDEPNKISKELSLRDEVGNADNFYVFFDPFKSGLNGFKFLVTASGVQGDAIITNNEEDPNWDAVWESAISVDEKGWYIEFKIPYSALRFPSHPIQEWNIQFGREVRRFREMTTWTEIDPKISGWVQQSGKVIGIENILSPVRLSLTPYVSGYINTNYNPVAPNSKKWNAETAYSAGLDLKYGINEAFTLDMTLIPDFGQVVSDKEVLNLTPFETFFEENRQFFTEGTELFDKGNIFYSRRIGSSPLHYDKVESDLKPGEKVIKNPEISQLYNATKISGRTSGGTGLGLFNAIVGKEHALVLANDGTERTIETNPLTNYNAIVADQHLSNNSFVSLMNTNVTRFGKDYDANVTGLYFDLKTKDQVYFIGGYGVLSQLFLESGTDRGHSYNLEFGKISGTWTYSISHLTESNNYNPNDMGYLEFANKRWFHVEGAYNQYKPQHPALQKYTITMSSDYQRLFKPNKFTNFNLNFDVFMLFKSRLGAGFDVEIAPVKSYDYFEPRTDDLSRFLYIPKNVKIGGFISSDYRKPFAYDIRSAYIWFNREGSFEYKLTLEPRIRFSDKWSVFTSTTMTWTRKEPGFVNKGFVSEPIDGLGRGDILMGIRNRFIVENSISSKYIFNNKMGINLLVRHYWDKVLYQHFGRLNNVGDVDVLPYNGLDNMGKPVFDRNVNIFTVDLQYNWRFAPGSDVVFVWKNQIFNSDKEFERNYFDNFGGLFNAHQGNNFSLKVLYYLDYLYLFPRQ